MVAVPDELAKNVCARYGQAGASWITGLPALVREICARWQLSLGLPYPGLGINFVAPATGARGERLVIKLAVPSRESGHESAALRAFGGVGMARLVDADPDAGAILVERAEPGTSLALLAREDDDAATSIAAQVMVGLRRPLPGGHVFPAVADWAFDLEAARRAGATGMLPEPLVHRATGLFARLLASSRDPVLLHGDLHHDNILMAGPDRWLAIDPKGVTGEPEYEAGALLRNPLPALLQAERPVELLSRRVERLAREAELDAGRVVKWAFAQAVLAAWWSIEDLGHGAEPWLACAEILATLAG